MDRKFALWFGVPTFAAVVCLVAAAYFAPTLFSDETYLVITGLVIALVSVVACVHTVLSIIAGNFSPLTALHPSVLLPFVVIFGLIGDAWGIRSALWDAFAMDAFDRGEGVRFGLADDGRFHPRITIDGTDVDFAVDTAAADIVLTPEDARRIGIDSSSLSFDQEIRTANGAQRAAGTRVRRIEIGPITIEDVPAKIAASNASGNVLGMAFFDRLGDWEVRNGTLMILQ